MNLLDRESEISADEVPIGFAVEDKEVLITDDRGNSVGFNQIGEIVVRSRYLSLGYWKSPELTRAKFEPDVDDPKNRTYYTGDLGLLLPDGCLIHKGRKDFRVKIRGYAVDLLEVEKALSSHSDIKEAVVSVEDSDTEDSRLIAYFTAGGEGRITVSDLRSYLGEKLADYMIPATFIQLGAIPLTPNGKVDRGALPKPDHCRPELSTPYALPTDETEKTLVRIWEEVLDIHPIGIHDDFFDLGGHSLSAGRVISRVIELNQLDIPLQSLFHSPTIAKMAAVITANHGKALDEGKLVTLLDELESLSDTEAQQRLSEKPPTTSKK